MLQVPQHFISRNNASTTELPYTKVEKKESQTNPPIQS